MGGEPVNILMERPEAVTLCGPDGRGYNGGNTGLVNTVEQTGGSLHMDGRVFRPGEHTIAANQRSALSVKAQQETIMKNTAVKQPYHPIGPLTQAQMLGLKQPLPGKQPGHIFKPWKTGKTYPYHNRRALTRGLARVCRRMARDDFRCHG